MTDTDTDTDTVIRQFRVRGTTDDITDCDLCGRAGLKSTVVLELLDAEGCGTGELVYAGSDCGARATGWTQKRINAEARTADRAAAEAAHEERLTRWRADRPARQAAFHEFQAWQRRTFGTTDFFGTSTDGRRISPRVIFERYEAEHGTQPDTTTDPSHDDDSMPRNY